MSLMPARASAEIAPPYLLGALGAAAVVAFLISLAVGPSGFGFGHGAGRGAVIHERRPRAHPGEAFVPRGELSAAPVLSTRFEPLELRMFGVAPADLHDAERSDVTEYGRGKFITHLRHELIERACADLWRLCHEPGLFVDNFCIGSAKRANRLIQEDLW